LEEALRVEQVSDGIWRRLRRAAQRPLVEPADLLHGAPSAGSPVEVREALVQALRLATGAAALVLFEPDELGNLRPTSSAGMALPNLLYATGGLPVTRSGEVLPHEGPDAVVDCFIRGSAQEALGPGRQSRLPAPLKLEGVVAGACHPLPLDGACAGVAVLLWTTRRGGARHPADIARLLGEIANRLRHADLLHHLESLAHLDAVTRVPNRRAWNVEIGRRLAEAGQTGETISVVLIDLDDFKVFNDDWGAQAGDELLRELARGWRRAVGAGHFLVRYGGDEFALAVSGGAALAESMVELMRPHSNPRQPWSAGVAEWDRRETAEHLMARAETALLASKRARRGGVRVSLGQGETQWAWILDRVLSRREMSAVYQSIRVLGSGRLHGYEALARPSSEHAADVSVEDLFTIAQRRGSARALDWLCRRAALGGARDLPPGCRLFINVGLWALLDPMHGVDQMLLLLQWAGRRPQDIVLEISEREALTDFERLRQVLADYRSAGFAFALDDIGEGHSTLEVLAAADPEYIKLARGLTQAVDRPGSRAAVLALVEFARQTGAQVIAEGLENEDDVRRIRDLGVTLGQGFALGAPEWLGMRREQMRSA
jgi:diguanylate cyclase (GGDEF)-like protein